MGILSLTSQRLTSKNQNENRFRIALLLPLPTPMIETHVRKVNAQLANISLVMKALPNSIVLVNVVFAPFAPITHPSRTVISIVRTELPLVPKLAAREKSSV